MNIKRDYLGCKETVRCIDQANNIFEWIIYHPEDENIELERKLVYDDSIEALDWDIMIPLTDMKIKFTMI